MKRFIYLDAFYQGGRSFFGAISIPYLLSKGLLLSDVATLKLVQATAMFVLEVPTGYLADRLGRKWSLNVSILFGILSFAAFLAAGNFMMFAVAEIALATALAFWSGAFDAYAIESASIEDDSQALNYFYHQKSAIVNAAIMIAGFTGGLLAATSLTLPYILSIVVFVVLFFWLWLGFAEERVHLHKESSSKIMTFLKTSSDAIKAITEKEILLLTIGFVVLEFLIQPLIYYWQGWVMKIEGKGIEPILGGVYVWFQIVIILSGMFFARYSSLPLLRNSTFWIACWIIYSLSNIVITGSSSLVGALSMFTLMEVAFNVGDSAMRADLNKRIGNQYRATFLSFVSLLTKGGAMLCLVVLNQCISHSQNEFEGLKVAFLITGLVGVVSFGGIFIAYTYKKGAACESVARTHS